MSKQAKKPTLEDRVSSLEKQNDHMRKQLREMRSVLSAIDEKKAARQLQAFQSRLTDLGKRLEVEILKDTVISEVARMFPSAWPHLVRALDLPDDWRMMGESLTIKGWKQRVEEETPGQPAEENNQEVRHGHRQDPH